MPQLSSVDYSSISCGIDLGGTKTMVALVDTNGGIHAQRTLRDYRGLSEDEIVAMIAATVRELTGGEPGAVRLGNVGVGTAGHVNVSEGILISNSNLPGFTNYPLAGKMSDALGCPVSVDNDANAQAYAEYRFGAGRGHSNVAFVTISTGVGAGIIIDGMVYHGVTGTAGEIGHTIVNPQSRIRCGCGNYGCLMAHASGLTLPDNVRQKIREGGTSSIRFDTMDDAAITGELIRSGLEDGDQLCSDIVTEYGYYLGLGLHNLVQTLNPGIIVLGGGLTAWGEPYLAQVRKTFLQLVGKTIDHPPEIAISELGAKAAVIGAATLAQTLSGGPA